MKQAVCTSCAKNAESLTLNLLTTTIVALPSNASKWQMGFNSAFKGLMLNIGVCLRIATTRFQGVEY